MANKMLLLSVKPEHARKIFAGSKTIEFRRIRPKLSEGDLVVVYVSSPVKAIMGAFEVGKIYAGSPVGLWRKVKEQSGLTWSEFSTYFANAEMAYGLEIRKMWIYSAPIKLHSIRKLWDDFNPPQSFRYITDIEHEELLLHHSNN
jgi:predicted transcriptional regulator